MSNENSETTEDTGFDINESTYKTSHTAVRKARRFALQGLYEWLMTDHRFAQAGQTDWQQNPPHDIAARTRATNAMHTVHLGYYHEMMRDIPQQADELDALIEQYLDRSIDQIDMVEHVVLLIGAYELKHSLHIPYKVVIDEAMKLNTHFGATDAHKLINAVMDKLAVELRAIEVEADGGTVKKAEVNDTDATTTASSTKSDDTETTVDEDNAVISEKSTTAETSTTRINSKKPRLSRKSNTEELKRTRGQSPKNSVTETKGSDTPSESESSND